jgi:hypothetical protein
VHVKLYVPLGSCTTTASSQPLLDGHDFVRAARGSPLAVMPGLNGSTTTTVLDTCIHPFRSRRGLAHQSAAPTWCRTGGARPTLPAPLVGCTQTAILVMRDQFALCRQRHTRYSGMSESVTNETIERIDMSQRLSRHATGLIPVTVRTAQAKGYRTDPRQDPGTRCPIAPGACTPATTST